LFSSCALEVFSHGSFHAYDTNFHIPSFISLYVMIKARTIKRKMGWEQGQDMAHFGNVWEGLLKYLQVALSL